MFQVFKTESTNLMIKSDHGKLQHVETQISFAWDYDEGAPDFDCGSDAKNTKEQARFDSGELLNLCLKVTASCLGETGTDYLGGCFVTARSMVDDLTLLASEHDMKNNACVELKANVLLQWDLMKKVLM